MEIKYKITARSPLYTGAGNQIGIKSELRKQKVKIKNPTKVISKFAKETDRELAFVDILTMLYAHISPDYRMKRGKDIWKSSRVACCKLLAASQYRISYLVLLHVSMSEATIPKYYNI